MTEDFWLKVLSMSEIIDIFAAGIELFINLYKYESLYFFCSYAAQSDAVYG